MPRDRILRVIIGWSYDFLSEAEQMLLRRLSVFVGGWTVTAAESVCWGRGLESDVVAELLAQLEAKALLRVERQNGELHYRMLEAIRQYGRDKLVDAGETDWVQGRFLDFYLRLAEEADAKLQGGEQSVWLDRLEAEYNNLRAALEWGQASQASAEAGLRLAGALWRFWYLRGKLSEGRLWLEGALTGARGGTSARAKVFNVAGHLAFAQNDLIAARLFHEESLAIRRESGDKRGIVNSLSSLGQVLKAQGEYGQAERLYEESLAVSRELGTEESLASALYDLGCVLLIRGSYQRSAGILQESLGLWREIGETGRIANCLVALAQADYAQGPEPALKTARLLGAASILLDTISSPLPSDLTEYERSMSAVRARLGEAAFTAAWAEGRTMSREQAIAYALEA
jgi:non-specific serine/threonine protein kinase